jgi:hypothetical protein
MKNNFIIISEHRVGSRWMHYLFAELLGMTQSPEMDRDRLYKDGIPNTYSLLKNNQIPKFHRATYWDIESAFGENELKVLGVVRNPRDRAVSLAFHNRYHRNHHFKQADFETDEEAVKYTIMEDKGYRKGNMRQLSLMIPLQDVYSVSKWSLYPKYVWVTYQDLLEDTEGCVETICKHLDLEVKNSITKVVRNHSFKNKSKRNPGEEVRYNLWKRKGVAGDYLNWFDDEMLDMSELDDRLFYSYANVEV